MSTEYQLKRCMAIIPRIIHPFSRCSRIIHSGCPMNVMTTGLAKCPISSKYLWMKPFTSYSLHKYTKVGTWCSLAILLDCWFSLSSLLLLLLFSLSLSLLLLLLLLLSLLSASLSFCHLLLLSSSLLFCYIYMYMILYAMYEITFMYENILTALAWHPIGVAGTASITCMSLSENRKDCSFQISNKIQCIPMVMDYTLWCLGTTDCCPYPTGLL